jgi:hypothetical protein
MGLWLQIQLLGDGSCRLPGRFGWRRSAGSLFFTRAVELLVQGDLLRHRQLFAASLLVCQAQSTAIIGTPLALATVWAGVFPVTEFHLEILRFSSDRHKPTLRKKSAALPVKVARFAKFCGKQQENGNRDPRNRDFWNNQHGPENDHQQRLVES